MPAWSVQTRRAQPRYSKDARVYGHTNMAMHDTEYLSYRVHPPFEHHTVIRAWCKYCRPGRRKPDVPRPDIVGMRRSMGIRLRPCTTTNTYRVPLPPPPPARPSPSPSPPPRYTHGNNDDVNILGDIRGPSPPPQEMDADHQSHRLAGPHEC